MSHKFTPEEKEVSERTGGNYFGFGVFKVTIGQIELDETDSGKEYIEVTVLGDNGEEDTARVWFTSPKAANYSFNVLRQIYVHNAPEEAKDEARDTMDAAKDAEELARLLNEKLIGRECWFSKYPDPTRTYTAKDGTVKLSVNKNVYGYEPKARPELLNADSATNLLAGAKKVEPGSDAAKNIPSSW